MKKALVVSIILMVFVGFLTQPHIERFVREFLDERHIERLSQSLDGSWKLTEFRAAGIFSGSEEEEATGLIDSTVSIVGDNISFNDGTVCRMKPPQLERREDNMVTFGSGGGSWANLGLIRSPSYNYWVIKIAFNCDEKFWGMTIQPDQGLYLLSVELWPEVGDGVRG